jgi:hypothetical protein
MFGCSQGHVIGDEAIEMIVSQQGCDARRHAMCPGMWPKLKADGLTL